MKNLRFWQKTYLLTLLLFLVAFYGGIILIGWQNQQMTMSREMDKAKNEQNFVTQTLSRDLSSMMASSVSGEQALFRSYGQYYRNNGLYIEVRMGDELLFSALPEDSRERPELQVGVGAQNWLTREYDGVLYSVVSSRLTDGFENYTLVSVRSLEPLTEQWALMRGLLTMGSIVVSVILAVGLFIILRGLSKPLERLAQTANRFAQGYFGARAVKQGNDEIGNLAVSFNAMADTAERNIREILEVAEQNARMAANLSHEIRTPLTAIQGYAEYMRLADLTVEEKDTALQYIIEESARLQKISERMLLLSSLKHDTIQMQPIKADDIIHRVKQSIRQKAALGMVNLHIQSDCDASIIGDDVLLESLFLNLLDNAIKACGEDGKVHLTTERRGEAFLVNINDNGRGMQKTELVRLGEPFYRPDASRSRGEGGAGLGIALCYQIADLHSANLTFDSVPGKGTNVTVKFTAL